MGEENTKDLTQDEKLDLILAEIRDMKADIRSLGNRVSALEVRVEGLDARLTSLDARLTSLEAKVDERLHDTRPMWQVIHAQTEKLVAQYDEVSKTLRLMDKKYERIANEWLTLYGKHELPEERIHTLEQRPA